MPQTVGSFKELQKMSRHCLNLLETNWMFSKFETVAKLS